MPAPAFVPSQLDEAEGRSFKSFYPRQVRGLALGAAGGILVALVLGVRTPAGILGTFLGALPGFAYGFYSPYGRPVEHWLRTVWRFHTQPQVARFGRGAARSEGGRP